MMVNTLSRAVQFGKSVDKGMEGGETAFPFIYTFVPSTQDTWDVVKDPQSLQLNHIDLGPVIPAVSATSDPGHVQIPVKLDADHMFKLLYIKYTAYYQPTPIAVPDLYAWELGTPGIPVWFEDTVTQDLKMSDSIGRWLRANVSIAHNSRYIYGNANSNVGNNGGASYLTTNTNISPMPAMLESFCSPAQSGFATARTPVLLPADGLLMFDLYNFLPYPVVIAAMIYGMKVRL